MKKTVPFTYFYREMAFDPTGFTPLMIAVSDDWCPLLKEKLVKLLLSYKADYQVCSPTDDNLFHLCTKYCESEALCCHLIEKLVLDLTAPNDQGHTPLDVCNLLKRPVLGKKIKVVQTT